MARRTSTSTPRLGAVAVGTELPERRELPVLRELQAQQALRAQLVLLVQREQRERPVRLAGKVLRGQQDLVVPTGQPEQRV